MATKDGAIGYKVGIDEKQTAVEFHDGQVSFVIVLFKQSSHVYASLIPLIMVEVDRSCA